MARCPDSLGRRRVVLTALVCLRGRRAAGRRRAPDFGWLLAARALQSLSAGAGGIVVGQAIVRDCYEGAVARRAMSYLILVFNLSPALAPIVGGYAAAHQGWRAVFLLLAVLATAAGAVRVAPARPWLRNSASPCPGAAWPGTTAGCWATRASCRWGWPLAWSSPPRAS